MIPDIQDTMKGYGTYIFWLPFQFDAEGSIGGIGWPYPIPGGMGPNSPGGGGFILKQNERVRNKQ